jgi:hypothetical protein
MTARLAYSDKEAAEALGLRMRSVIYLRSTGKLGFSSIGRRVLIPAREIERLLQQGYVRPNGVFDPAEPIRPRNEAALYVGASRASSNVACHVPPAKEYRTNGNPNTQL